MGALPKCAGVSAGAVGGYIVTSYLPLHQHVVSWLLGAGTNGQELIDLFFEKVGAPEGAHMGAHRVPIRGPEGARRKKISRSGTERICAPPCIHACPEGAIISRSGTERICAPPCIHACPEGAIISRSGTERICLKWVPR